MVNRASSRVAAIAAALLLLLAVPAAGAAPPAGSAPSNFDTWFLLQNPNAEAANATVTFSTEGGRSMERSFELAPHSRKTVFANEYVESEAYATTVESDRPVVAERSEYFDFRGEITGGHSKPGSNAPSRRWYFAEGYTGPGFNEYLLVQNPAPSVNTVDATFMKEDGSTVTSTFDIASGSRFTLDVGSVPEVGGGAASVVLESRLPVTAERAMYFDYGEGLEGGDCVAGARAPSNDWFFAEGYTGEGFDTWILVMNPNDAPVEAGVYFDTGGGG